MINLDLSIELALVGEKAAARQLLAEVVCDDPFNEQAWLWLAYCAKSKTDRRLYLEQALLINPANNKVRSQLARLGGA